MLRARDEGKAIVVSMSSVAASGGLYIAMAADTIVANPGTLTGSIGVILQYQTMSELADKIGVRRVLLIGEIIGGVFVASMFTMTTFPQGVALMVLAGRYGLYYALNDQGNRGMVPGKGEGYRHGI